jgi:hypothetical protein
MAILNIDSVDMPHPTTFKPLLSDVDLGSARMANANLKRKRVYAGKRSFNFTYSYLSQADCSTLLLAIKPASFTVICPDPETGANGTFTMYCSDRSIETLDFGKVSAGVPRWRNISFTFVEY